MVPKDQIKWIKVTLDPDRCWYCGTDFDKPSLACPPKMRTVDHQIRERYDFQADSGFLVPCCHRCNASKSDRTVPEYRGRLWYFLVHRVLIEVENALPQAVSEGDPGSLEPLLKDLWLQIQRACDPTTELVFYGERKESNETKEL